MSEVSIEMAYGCNDGRYDKDHWNLYVTALDDSSNQEYDEEDVQQYPCEMQGDAYRIGHLVDPMPQVTDAFSQMNHKNRICKTHNSYEIIDWESSVKQEYVEKTNR